MGKLYLIESIPRRCQEVTLRALRVMGEVSMIVAHDVNAVRDLLAQCQLSTPVHELSGREALLEALRDGDVAWIGGGLSHLASSLIRTLLDRGVEIVPIPGAPVEIAALVTSGLPTDRFAFLGLLPSSSPERRALLRGMAQECHTLVCNVQAEHLPVALGDLQSTLGDRRMAIYHEGTIWRGRASQASDVSGGQVTLVIEGAGPAMRWTEAQVREEVRALLAAAKSPRDAAREVTARSGWSKRKVYAIAMREDAEPG